MMSYSDISTSELLQSIAIGVWPPRVGHSHIETSAGAENPKLPGPAQLDLSNRGLEEFPRELFALKDTLEVLNLGGNSISSLPDDFVEFRRLRILFFAGNKFTSVPSILGRMPSLYMLSFKSNVIDTIPEDSLSPSVGWLILTDNKITHLPPSIGELTGLRKLMLANNQLQRLPIELSRCVNLELIRLSRNRLTSLPSWLLHLPRLSWVALAGNPCVSLPENSYRSGPDDIKLDSLVLGDVLGQGASGIVRKVVAVDSSLHPSSDDAGTDIAINTAFPEIPPGRWDGIAFKQFLGIRGSDGHPSDEVAIARILMQSSMKSDSNGTHASNNLLPILGCIAEPLADGDISNKDDFNYGILFPMIPGDCKLLAGPPSFLSVTRDVYPKDSKFPVDVVLGIVKGIAAACNRLHSLGIMHGDVYGHNIHVYEDGHPVLVDLGASTLYSRYLPDSLHVPDGTLSNADVIRLCERIEIRAFSYLVEELVDRIHPDSNYPSLADTILPLKKIISLCQSDDVISRPTFDEICSMLT